MFGKKIKGKSLMKGVSKGASKPSRSEVFAERDFNLLYITVNPAFKPERLDTQGKPSLNYEVMNNLAIYQIETGQQSYFFGQHAQQEKEIISFFFEQRYDETHDYMDLKGKYFETMNNYKIGKRKPADVLFVLTKGAREEDVELWQSNKLGQAPRLVKKFIDDDNWWLDIANQKIMFVKKSENHVEVEAIDW